MDLVGDVKGADAIIVDDMIDTAGTLCAAAAELIRFGAKRVFAFATHGLLNGPAVDRISKSTLERVVVTNTIEMSAAADKEPKIHQISIAPLLAEAVRRTHKKESLSSMFKKGAKEIK